MKKNKLLLSVFFVSSTAFSALPPAQNANIDTYKIGQSELPINSHENYSNTKGNTSAKSKPDDNSLSPEQLSNTCTAAKKDYAEQYAGLFKPKPSIMSECAIGRLVDFNILEYFDPTMAILDAMQGVICGWVEDTVNPYISKANHSISSANAMIADSNRGYSEFVSDAARGIYYQGYEKHKQNKDNALGGLVDSQGNPLIKDNNNQENGTSSSNPPLGAQAQENSTSNNQDYTSSNVGDIDETVIINNNEVRVIESEESTSFQNGIINIWE
jgi:hypothetical protein